jgi:hypothetical protein
MKVTRITIVVLWALTMLPLAPLAAKAAVDGFGMHSPPATGMHSPPATGHLPPYDPFRHRHHHHHRAFGLWPYGYYDVPQDTPEYDSIVSRLSRSHQKTVRCGRLRFYVVRRVFAAICRASFDLILIKLPIDPLWFDSRMSALMNH